jgi:hydrogenase-4 component F
MSVTATVLVATCLLGPLVGAALALRVKQTLPLSRILIGASVVTSVAAYGLGLGLQEEVGTTAGGYLVVDATARLFLMLVDFIFLGIATYIGGRVEHELELHHHVERFVAGALVFLAAANLAILSNHLMMLWVAIEATTLVAVPLIRYRPREAAKQAAWRYLVFSSVGLGLTMLGLACLDRSLGPLKGGEVSFFLHDLVAQSRAAPDLFGRIGLALVFLGFGTKLGLAPMYAWLPETYEAALPSVTALLAAVQFNVALVGVFRVFQVFRAVDQQMVSLEFATLGLLTMVVSAFGLVGTHSYKKLIAYAALNHGGVIAIGLGIGKTAAYGVVVYVVSNAIIKAILFLSAGRIRAHYHTDDMREVSGLLKELPYSGFIFAIGIFALLGFPPFGSFLGELIIMSSLVRGGYFALFAALCGLLTLAFVATGRSVFPMIWGAPKREAPPASQVAVDFLPKLVLLAFLVAMGVYLPAPINTLFRQVAADLGGQ